jgi:hypothetical protein
MRGRRPRPLAITRDDLSSLLSVVEQLSLPAYQVQRARIVLGVAAGEPITELAERNYCDPATVWRVCRRYEHGGLDVLLAAPTGRGRAARISPPAAGSDRRTGLP